MANTQNITTVSEIQAVENSDKVFVNDNGTLKQVSVSNLMKQAPSGITEETDPTVPAWAKEPTKPTYTAQEVGALPVGTKIPAKTSDLTNDSGYLTQIPEEYVTETELGQKGYITEDDIPEKLPSPGTLTFTGAVNDTYDGSADKTINIPTGGGEGGTSNYENLTNQPKLNGVTLVGNKSLEDVGAQSKIIYDATKNGLSSENSGPQNSQALQLLIDKVSEAGGGSIYIPSGQYQFASNGSQTTGEHCIKLKSNVAIYGDGASTILLTIANATNGLDMFYFNDYVDNSNPTYLENCIFRDFVIDGTNQSCTNYTSAGKGFMINLMKNCHWYNVTVKNMDATGFGVDCPINCSMEKCYAIGNGKAAEITDVGASGFGIGFGYSYDESMFITGCTAVGNKKFGIFFEHQRRFDSEKYTATGNKGFLVAGCTAEENYNNFGGIQAINALYRNCVSQSAIIHGYFFQNSEQCNVIGCYSNNDGDTSFVVLADNTDGGTQETKDVAFISSISKYPKYGAKLVNLGSTATMQRNIVKDCYFNSVQTNTILTSGTMQSMVLEDNVTNSAENNLGATVTDLLDRNNSWNSSGDYTLPIMSSAQLGGGKAIEKTDEDVPVAVDPLTGQLFVPTYPESGSGAGGITVSYDAEQQAIVFTNSSGGGN